MKLLINAMTKYLAGLVLVGLLLFPAAGGFDYMNAWLFIALLFVPMFLLGLVLFLKAPELLQKRLNSKEKENAQKGVVLAALLIFVGAFMLAGLDHRFGWTHVPAWLVAAASVILLVSYGLYAEVMRENAYLSRTVEVQAGQKLVDTGLYGIVRHPMYAVTILLFLSMPLVLGSWISFALLLVYPLVIVLRIKNEEQVLEKGLEGYKEYKNKVKYRLIPGIW
ncbi:MAG: isoprenylcysteine carboxylmethyltransferase family protein [Oscillospiraceae bacterium]|nr:isoprenylcysteine carboxylmethyltransferase family protein [Oscillospiraceae bacterium]